MATHLVKIFSKNGTLEFPAPLAHFFLASVSVWNTQCLCGTHTVSLWQAHSVSVAQPQCLSVEHTQKPRGPGRAGPEEDGFA